MTLQRLFLSPPHLGTDELNVVNQAFESNYIAPLGPMVDKFEQEFSEYTGIGHCVALSSGTGAMHLALRHLGIGSQGLEVRMGYTSPNTCSTKDMKSTVSKEDPLFLT